MPDTLLERIQVAITQLRASGAKPFQVRLNDDDFISLSASGHLQAIEGLDVVRTGDVDYSDIAAHEPGMPGRLHQII